MVIKEEDAYSNSVEVVDKGIQGIRRRTSTLEQELQVWDKRSIPSQQDEQDELTAQVIFGVSEAPRVPLGDAISSVIAPDFWSTAVKDLNGSSGSRYEYDDMGELECHDTWSCFKIKQVQTEPKLSYTWQQPALFVKWQATDTRRLILTLDASRDLQRQWDLRLPDIDDRDPYAWQVVFVEEVVKLYDKSVWSLRDLVRNVEKTRGSHCTLDDISQLHEISRHLGHSHETLDIALNIIRSISSEHKAFWAECKGDSPDNRRLASQVQRRLSSLSLELGNITRRSVSLKERLQYEINLAHNMVSHRNTHMMRTISAMTLLFLPGTFVSGIFSSAFFQFSSDTQEWVVARNFWLYWVIVIPLTMATLFIWLMKYHRDEIGQWTTFFWAKIARRKPRGGDSSLFAKNP